MIDDVEVRRITDGSWESAEAEGLIETDDGAEPIVRAASAPDAVPGLRRSAGPWDPPPPAIESDAGLPATNLEPRGRLTRAAPLFFFFMFSMSIVFVIGMFIGASRTANLPARPPPAEASGPVTLSPRIETPTADSSTAGYSSPEPATPQLRSADMTTTEAAPAPSSSATVPPEDAPVALDPMPAPKPASAQPAAVVDAPPLPAEPAPAPPMPTETVASTPSPIAPAQAPATAPTERDIQSPTERDIQIQALLSRGDAFFSAGDVTSARLFYQRGADAGDHMAALRLGETFDAAFLERAHLGRVPGDLEKAISWYRRARDLGNTEAEILLEELARQLMK